MPVMSKGLLCGEITAAPRSESQQFIQFLTSKWRARALRRFVQTQRHVNDSEATDATDTSTDPLDSSTASLRIEDQAESTDDTMVNMLMAGTRASCFWLRTHRVTPV